MRANSHRAARPHSSPRGFTLIELMVSLAVGGIAILGARSILGALADHADRVSETAAWSDRAANGERTLRLLLGNLEIGTTPDASFGGDERQASFTSWCQTPSGWTERCRVRLSAVTHVPSSNVARHTLTATLSTGEVAVLLDDADVLELRYLRDAAHGGSWFRQWGAGITAPLAIGIVRGGDTLIVRIGDRG